MNAPIPRPKWIDKTPPDYVAVYMRRAALLKAMRADKTALAGALLYYAENAAAFINDWCDTADPRNAGDPDKLASMPLIMFPRQFELVDFFEALRLGQANGIVEKSRDMGATWVAVAYSAWLWRFHPDSSVGWGSRKQEYVDEIGNMDSIFEKIRHTIKGWPRDFWPKGFSPNIHFSMKRILNPENGSSITGEIGDEIGRGGRKTIFFVDEAAHLARPDLIEASLSMNTRIRIEISSVNGTGNVFHRKRQSGTVWAKGGEIARNRSNVFIMDWAENPMHTQQWYDDMRAEKESQGLLHIFEQEVNRNYAASVEGVIIPQAWVLAARNAHKRFPEMANGTWRAGFDPYNEGRDKHALVRAQGTVIRYARTWTEGDTGEATRETVRECRKNCPIDIQFDAIGVGAGVTAESNRLAASNVEGDKMPKGMRFISFVASARAIRPDERVENMDEDTRDEDGSKAITNKEMFMNLKAQAGWNLRRRFERTFNAVTKGEEHNPMDMISIDTDSIPPDMLAELERQLSQPVRKKGSLKLVIDKTPDGTDSPNFFDATMICMFPVSTGYVYDLENAL